MKFILFLAISILSDFASQAQEITGKWENRNDEGVVNSIIEVYQEGDTFYAKVDKIMKKEDRERVCTNCEGDLKNKPVQGMVIMQDMHKEGNAYEGGTIVDPKSGKEYRCKIWLDEENPDILKVRGYLSFFYKTKTWERAE